MEYLEGETLSQRLRKGSLPLDQVLRYAVEIADALDKAHRKGITHRDLKPGNVMLTKAGTKLLDFGLAKLRDPKVAGISPSERETRSAALTGEGKILGTLQYMAPAQLEGKDADARTDVFAFGALVYEMATGQRVFSGASQASLIAAILDAEPAPTSAAQPLTPAVLDRVVRKCLAKDPEDRWQAVRDVTGELQWIAEGGAQARVTPEAALSTTGWRRALPWSIAAVMAIIAGLSLWSLQSAIPVSQPLTRLSVGVEPADRSADSLSDSYGFSLSRTGMTLSADGRVLVFTARRGDTVQLYRRELDQVEAVPMPGTEGAQGPFFSPDGQWVGFSAAGELKKVPIGGGPPVTVCETDRVFGASWGPDNRIVFAREGGGLLQVSGDGGTPGPLTTLDADTGEVSHRLPQILPGGGAVLFTVLPTPELAWEQASIAVESLVTRERTLLVDNGADARYVPTGHLVFVRVGTLMAAPFDLRRLEITGGVVALIEGIAQTANVTFTAFDTGAGQFSVSDSGSLAYVAGGIVPDLKYTLVWVDRHRVEEPLLVEPLPYFGPQVSPDGQRVAFWTLGRTKAVWVYDMGRGGGPV